MLKYCAFILTTCISLCSIYTHALPLPKPNVLKLLLPEPEESPKAKQTISIFDAINIALKNSDTIESAQKNYSDAKYSFSDEKRIFIPQLSKSIGSTISTGVKQKTNFGSIGSNLSVKTPIGTSASISYSHGIGTNDSSSTLNISQPLLNGWGETGRQYQLKIIAFNNQKRIYTKAVSTFIQTVINQYRALILSHNSLNNLKRNLDTYKENVKNSKMKIQAGTEAAFNLQQQILSLDNARYLINSNERNYSEQKSQFLQILGLSPTLKFNIVTSIPRHFIKIPNRKTLMKLALKNNPAYKDALARYQRSLYQLKSAKNKMLWTVNASATDNLGHSALTPLKPIEDGNNADGLSLQLSIKIPINRRQEKYDLQQAKIEVTNARRSLKRAHYTVESTIKNNLYQIENQIRSIKQDLESIKLQEKMLYLYRLQLKYGKVSQYIVDQNQDDLYSKKNQLISDQITYMNNITTLREYVGTLLNHWNIKLRY